MKSDIIVTVGCLRRFCQHDVDEFTQLTPVCLAAQSHGLKLVMYEGGPGVMENGVFTGGAETQAITDKAIAFNQDPHIQQPLQDILQAWYDVVTTNGSNASPGKCPVCLLLLLLLLLLSLLLLLLFFFFFFCSSFSVVVAIIVIV